MPKLLAFFGLFRHSHDWSDYAPSPEDSRSGDRAAKENCNFPNEDTIAAINQLVEDRGVGRLKTYASIQEMTEALSRLGGLYALSKALVKL